MIEGSSLPALPQGYISRPAVLDDAPAISDLLIACDVDVSGSSDMSLSDFLGDWTGVDLEADTIVVVNPAGAPVAYADTHHRGFLVHYVYGDVHPAERGKGLGTFLVRWGEQRANAQLSSAPDHARVVIRHYINQRATFATDLLQTCGYAPIRLTFVMKSVLSEEPAAPELPPGLVVRTYRPSDDEVATWEAYEEAFADMWQRPRGTLEQFQAMTQRPYFDPALWFLGLDGQQIVATVLASEIEGKGWIEIVGVRRPWRGRGFALAMLQHAIHALWQRGVREIGLSVDAESPTGATRIYTRAGMHVDQTYVIYERELRPGENVLLPDDTE